MSDFLIKNKKNIIFLLLVAGIFLAMKYLLPLFLPLVLAFLVIAPMNPFLEKAHKKLHIGKGFLAGIILLLVCTVLGIFVWWACSWCLYQVGVLIRNLEMYQNQFNYFVLDCCKLMETRFGVNAVQLKLLVLESVDVFIEDMEVQILPKIMDNSMFCLKLGIGAITFLVVTVIGAVLLAKDFETMKKKLSRFHYYNDIKHILSRIGVMISSFFKAQILILLVIAIICMAGFYFARIPYPIVLGIVTGILDVLPFVGTGIILLPLSIWQLLNGQIVSGIILAVAFVVSALARELLEPKLIGAKMGIFPIGILIAVYAGVQIFGIIGVFLGPLYMMILCECYKLIYNKSDEEDLYC